MARAPKKILLVQDNADLRELLALIIGLLRYEVVVASTGEEAVERASAMPPDLILMDIGLPKLNGAEAIVKIKGNPATKHIPIVILSALRMCPDIKRALEAGAVEILQKPVNVPKIQEVLSRTLPYQSEDIHAGDLAFHSTASPQSVREAESTRSPAISDDLTYRGYRIVCDVRQVPSTRIWMGKAAVVEPADAYGIERVSPIFTADCFSNKKAACDYLITEAKQWIEKQITNQLTNEITQ